MKTTHDLIKSYLRSINFTPLSILNYSIKESRILLNFTEGKRENPKTITLELPLMEYFTFLFNKNDNSGVKPILITILSKSFNEEQYHTVMKGLDNLIKDEYHTITLVDNRREEIEFKVLNVDDYDSIKMNEIIKYIERVVSND